MLKLFKMAQRTFSATGKLEFEFSPDQIKFRL